VSVLNPLSKDHQVLRQSLIPGLLEAVKYNVDHGEKDVWLFEIGRAYFARKSGQSSTESKAGAESPVVEKPKVAAVIMGNPSLSNWTEVMPSDQNHQNGGSASGETLPAQKDELNFYQAKGVVENLFRHLRINLDRIAYSSAQSTPAMMHPGKTARIDHITEGKESSSAPIGWLGEIHPSCADKLGLDFATYAFELDMETLAKLREAPLSKPITTSPVVSRDLTIDLAKNADNAAVVACIKASAGNNFKGIELVSKFPLSNELKSLSYRLTFQHPEQTLRSEEVDQELTKIRTALQNQLGASFRT
jgi:phenylalanyl-tRNA synthetase beta chain